MADQNRLLFLLDLLSQHRATAEDFSELLSLVKWDEEVIDQLTSIYGADHAHPSALEGEEREYWSAAAAEIVQATRPALVRHIVWWRRKWLRYAAASALVIMACAYFYFTTEKKNPTNQQATALANTAGVKPGGNRATLTLGDGSIITLDSAANGSLAQQGNAAIVKLANGEIAYRANATIPSRVFMNTMRTPKGGTYQLALPDGSRVWLNAASSVTFPSSFIENERRVIIDGEAYLEVTADKRPFIIQAKGVAVQVLGTSFNVHAYANEEAIRTTLIDGSVRVLYEDQGLILKPGQQAVSQSKRLNLDEHVNVEQVLAWKNGLFSLENADVREVMRQLARWYDVDVRYEGELPGVKFKGSIDRGADLSEVLKFLSGSGVHLELQNKTIIVRP